MHIELQNAANHVQVLKVIVVVFVRQKERAAKAVIGFR